MRAAPLSAALLVMSQQAACLVQPTGMPVRRPQPAPARSAVRAEGDYIENMFTTFFGKPVEGEVAGLARTAGAPDTYPATKTEFADPVEGDDVEMARLRPMLKNTNLETLRLRLAYDASRNGWSAASFHEKIDKQGPCLVVCETIGGAFCGGYAAKGFAGYGEYRGSLGAFLFTWPTPDAAEPTKLQKIGGAGLATIDEPETGPRFGADGLCVFMNPGAERVATSKVRASGRVEPWSRPGTHRSQLAPPFLTVPAPRAQLGPYYEAMPDGTRHVFTPGEDPKATELTALRVYVGVWPEGERIPYDGAIPFAIE